MHFQDSNADHICVSTCQNMRSLCVPATVAFPTVPISGLSRRLTRMRKGFRYAWWRSSMSVSKNFWCRISARACGRVRHHWLSLVKHWARMKTTPQHTHQSFKVMVSVTLRSHKEMHWRTLKRSWGLVSVELPGMHDVLRSVPSTHKQIQWCIPVISAHKEAEAGGLEAHSHLRLHGEFKDNLGNMRTPKTKQKNRKKGRKKERKKTAIRNVLIVVKFPFSKMSLPQLKDPWNISQKNTRIGLHKNLKWQILAQWYFL